MVRLSTTIGSVSIPLFWGAFVVFLILPRNRALAENWPRWRGPEGLAVSQESPLPLSWGKDKNIRWKAKIPGEGFSSPIVWKDRVFVTSAFDEGLRRAVHCVERQTGKTL